MRYTSDLRGALTAICAGCGPPVNFVLYGATSCWYCSAGGSIVSPLPTYPWSSICGTLSGIYLSIMVKCLAFTDQY